MVFNIFLGHESASWSWFCAFQGLWNLTPSSAAIQPNKPRMFMTILICLSWFAQIWSYTGYTLWIEFTARFRTTWNDEIDVLCQDRSWKASPIQKAWSESFGKVCCQTKRSEDALPSQTQTCWMEGLHAINKAEQGCCALDRGGDFAFAFDRSACA